MRRRPVTIISVKQKALKSCYHKFCIPTSLQNGLESLADPQQPEDDPDSYITMPIINKFGQRYQCMLPKTSLEMDSSKEGKEEPESTGEPVEDKPVDIKELLKPMAKGPCLFKTRDWWTYEFCYGEEIRQYHMEGRADEEATNHPVVVVVNHYKVNNFRQQALG